jgi:hypothetical protein
MRPEPPSSSGRREAPGLVLDPAGRSLRIGDHRVALAPGASNSDVLSAYVQLVAAARLAAVPNLVDVRHEDVEALAAALDLEAGDLEAGIEAVLGASRSQAQALIARLRGARPIGGLQARVGSVVMPREGT